MKIFRSAARLVGLWGLFLLLNGSSCSVGGSAANADSPKVQDYGAEGIVTAEEFVTLENLLYPQSYGAIKDAIGLPRYRDQVADYYTTPKGNWVTVFYDSDGWASGYDYSTQRPAALSN